MAGLNLDPWEEFVLAQSLGEREDGKWSAFEVGLVVARQNGKGAVLEGRELAGLFLLDEPMIIHSAHQFDTSLEAFRRLLALIEDTPELGRRVQRVSRSHGEEGIELKKNPRTGLKQRIRFRTRTKGGGRGFTGDLVILDEAMDLPNAMHGALLPTLSARSVTGNPQVWYTGSAVDQEIQEHGMVLARLRERGIRGDDPGLAYFEWSVAAPLEKAVEPSFAKDPEQWAMANPGLGIRISAEHIGLEQRSMDPRTFAVERLGAGDWPSAAGVDGDDLTIEEWSACEDARSRADDPVCFAFDVRPNRSMSAICAAGKRPDGRRHIEVTDHRPGTGWVATRLAELVESHRPAMVVCDKAGPAASLLAELEELKVEVHTSNAQELAQGCGLFVDAVRNRTLRHLGTPELTAAVRGAARRPLTDAWAWARKQSTADISPLVGCTLALWAHAQAEPASVYESRGILVI